MTWRDDNERLEAFRSRNSAFAFMDAILAAMEYARSVGVGAVPQARPEPTITVDDRLELSIGGRDLVLIATPGGETFDSMVVWLPESRTLFSGNLFGPLFGHVPNLVTIRGDRYRDALTYIDSLDVVHELAPERLVTGHFDPIDGADLIAEETAALQEAMRWVHDRTVDGMNAGADVHTLMREIRVPDHLDVGEGYGTDEVERPGDLGELRRLVPPPLHHRALRGAATGGRSRPGGRRRQRRADGRGQGASCCRATRRGAPAHRHRARSGAVRRRRHSGGEGRDAGAVGRDVELLGGGLAPPIARQARVRSLLTRRRGDELGRHDHQRMR